MKIRLFPGCFCIVLLSLFACVQKRFVYSPPPPNSPFFSQKGDSKIAGYLSKGEGRGDSGDHPFNHGYDLQAAYAIGNNWALTANFYKRKERDMYKSKIGDAFYDYFDTATINYNRSLTEVGFGYFTTGRPTDAKFNCYAGIGFGKFKIDDAGRNNGANYTRFHNSNVFKVYLQPGFYVTAAKNFSLAFVARLSLLSYSNISTSYIEDELRHFRLLSIYNEPAFFIEPSMIMQYEIPDAKWLKVEADLTLNKSFTTTINSRGSNASLGVVFDWSKIHPSK